MIGFIKKRLVVTFTSVIVGVNILFMAIVLVYIQLSILDVCKKHIREDIDEEFIPNYRQGGMEKLTRHYDEDLFQVLNKEGNILGGTIYSDAFTLKVDHELLKKALSGEKVFNRFKDGAKNYLIAYFPLDENHAGRIAMRVDEALKFRNNFLKLILISFPGMILLSFILSTYLVKHALKPAVAICDFQENYLSNITHELRSPLASLRGDLEVSLRKDRPVGEYREVIHLALKETERVIELLEKLHILATSRSKPLELFKDYTDLKKIVTGLVKEYAPQMQLKKIKLYSAELPDFYCVCDESLIKRAIYNLIDNAVKYTPEDGVIKLTASVNSKNAYLNITNTCNGLHEDDMKYLFEPFYRSRSLSQQKIEGQGLGLYIARYIVHSHKGDIKLHITDDNMFSVTMSLPLQ
jgi:two-component system, OmpR family, sensor histidine kinase CiaH